MKENVAIHKHCGSELWQIHFQDRNSVSWEFSHVFTVSSDKNGSCQCWVKSKQPKERFCMHPHRIRNTETFLFEHAQKIHISALTNIEMFLACKKLYPREIWVSIWTLNQIVISSTVCSTKAFYSHSDTCFWHIDIHQITCGLGPHVFTLAAKWSLICIKIWSLTTCNSSKLNWVKNDREGCKDDVNSIENLHLSEWCMKPISNSQ